MHPPFGFALFYLRSVAPASEYDDRITKKRIAPITTGQIYWGAVPFVCIQILMVGLIIAVPKLVAGTAAKESTIDVDKAFQQMRKDSAPGVSPPPASMEGFQLPASAASSPDGSPASRPAETGAEMSDDEAMKRLIDAAPKKP
jgi:hypothetical protein